MKKRLLAMLMVLSMALSILPMSAMAAPGVNGNTDEKNQIVNEGGTVYYNKEGTQVQATELGDNAVVKMTKTVEQTDKENAFEVTLQVQTNQKVKELQSENPDAAVVLVLDTSGSMAWCAECGREEHGWGDDHKFESRLALAKQAANQFLDQFAALEAESAESAHRWVQIISFNSNVSRKIDWVDVSTSKGLEDAKKAVNKLYANGGTNIEGGLMLARNNLKALKKEHGGINYLYTILLTDGKPTYHVWRNDETSLSGIMGAEGGGSETEPADAKDVGTWAREIREISKYSKLYSICFGSVEGKYGKKTPVWNETPFGNWSWVNPQTNKDMTIGEWLKAFSSAAYNGGTDGSDLFENFDSIMHQIALATKAFRVKDTMGERITYVDELPVTNNGKEVNNSVHVDGNEFTWNILQSEPVDRLCEGDASSETAILGYEFKYKVTLDNLTENTFEETPVNTQATLTYAVQDEDGEWQGGSDKEPLEGTFAQPIVKSHYGDLSFTKENAEGTELKGAEFTLTAEDGSWSKEMTSGENGEVSFENIPSGHTYTLTETKAPEGYLAVDPITVTVSYGDVTAKQGEKEIFLDDGTLVDQVNAGELKISKEVKTEDGFTPDPDQTFTFTVNFEDTGETGFTYSIQDTKTTGTIESGDALTLKANQTAVIEGLPVGTKYTVTESAPGNGFTQVIPDNGELATGTIESGTSEAKFVNQYKAEEVVLDGDDPTKGALWVQKKLSGKDWDALAEDSGFIFTLTGEEGAPMPEQTTVTIDKDTNDYKTAFGDITFQKEGTYTYTVKENIPEEESKLPGFTYDETEYTVTVQVKDNGNGELTIKNITYQKGNDTYVYSIENPMTFTNTYAPDGGTLTGETALKVTKDLEGREWQEGDSFTFTLTGSEGAPMPTDAQDGTATLILNKDKRSGSFGSITFQSADTYTYTVQETGQNGDGITLDTTVYTVTVTVKDEGGRLVPTVTYKTGEATYTYGEDGMTFTNQFTPVTVGGDGDEQVISVTKVLEGRGWKAGDTFSFTLSGADENTEAAIENGTVVLPDTLTIAYDGGSTNTILDNTNGALSVSGSKLGTFGKMTFNAEGTYTFLVQENTEGAVEGITYSKAEYQVIVVIGEKQEDGSLTVSSVTTKQTKNDAGAEVMEDASSDIVFTNVVTDQPTDTKSVTTGTTEDSDGIDPDGKVAGVGDILTYTIQWVNDAVDESGDAAEATVTVTDTIPKGTEYVENSAENATYDDTTKTLTWTINNAAANATEEVSFQVKVTEAAVENEDNTIENQATVKVGNNNSKQTTETKTYVPEKSVTGYQPEGGGSTTTVVPDNGLKVGDQLTYTISYKNTTDEAATVIITDKVPEGTKFISASNEGTNKDGTVTWTISNVAAGGTGSVTLTVEVTSSVEDAVTNQAQVQIGESDPKITVNTNTESTEIDKGDTITITPVDVTLYIGGTSAYWGEVDGDTVPEAESGIPAPHFYITGGDLSDQEIAALTFHGTGSDNVEKTWKVEPYGGTGEEQATGENGQKIWNIVAQDENEMDASCQYFSDEACTNVVGTDNIASNQYTTLYAKISTTDTSGAGNTDLHAKTVDGTEFALTYGTGVLTVRPVTDDATKDKNYTFDAAESSQATAEAAANDNAAAETATKDGTTAGVVVPDGTEYTVNGQDNWSLVGEEPSLLFDDVLSSYELEGDQGTAEETGHTMLEKAVSDNASKLGLDDMNGRQYESKYFDLVDSNDGNVWVEADQQVVVYWPYPEGITYETASDYEFDLFHFTGMHREYTQGEEDVQSLVDQAAGNINNQNGSTPSNETVALMTETITLTENGIQFIADQSSFGFSPFVLTWVEKDSDNGGGGGGGGGGNKPSLNTEDHYGYIVGYPVDYATGEPTDDQARKPVKPQGKITRAEVATIFFRMLTDESRNEYWSQSNDFTDVAADAWYNNAISTMANAGILDGYEDGSFHPNGYITRAEFATIAVRFFDLSYQGEDLFPDIDGHWAQDYINQAADAGIIEGYPDGTFGPQKQITRAEAVTMVNRTLDRHPDPDHFLEDMLVWPDNLDTEAWYYADMQEATNSHEYQMKKDAQGNEYEVWTKILPIRDWEALEKEWSDANSSENPGDVAG